MGRAIFDRQLMAGHVTHFIYKHMLGWPMTFKDIASIDEECFKKLSHLQELVQNGEDLSTMCLNFTTMQEVMGMKKTIELVKGGADIKVDNNNFPEYLEAFFKYRILDRIMPQLKELLLGFFDVIPEPLLAVFDFQELEVLMCGLPAINLDGSKSRRLYIECSANVEAT